MQVQVTGAIREADACLSGPGAMYDQVVFQTQTTKAMTA